jgi:hypothetical protein
MILATKSYCREYAEKISTGCEFLSGIGNTGQEFVGSPALKTMKHYTRNPHILGLIPKLQIRKFFGCGSPQLKNPLIFMIYPRSS